MSGKPRIGIAGLGDIARLHARGLSRSDDVELAVCRGRNPAAADSFAKEFAAAVYDSYDQMLDDERVIAVDICVPNDLHRPFAEQAASAGKHVICEKPIALTSADGREMLSACRRNGVQLNVAHILRFWPEYGQMRDLLRSNQLGPCRAVSMRRMLSLLANVSGAEDWRRKPERAGGAAIDLQIHDLDFLLWTFGMPRTVYCAAARSPGGGLDHVFTVLTYTSGLCAAIEASFLLQGDPVEFTTKAVCERGSLNYVLDADVFHMHDPHPDHSCRAAQMQRASLVCYRPGRAPEALAFDRPDTVEQAFHAEMSYFTECISGRAGNDRIRPEEAIAALEVAEACVESARTGQAVNIAEPKHAPASLEQAAASFGPPKQIR